MSTRQITLLALLVCVPLAVLAWLGWSLARDERARMRRELQDLLGKQAGDANQIVDRFFKKRQRELVMTARGRIGVWLKLIAPGLVDRMARAAVEMPSSS